ncbi:heme oxygenase (biliverdin-producing) [Marinactinospora thermotolerans]|uniref:biliverdin-producing heme oxygenase n=1 Tax=Marinactinospora thermotolerans TaxID=531310 RepID=UPI003D8BF776
MPDVNAGSPRASSVSLSRRLRDATSDEHDSAERHGFTRALLEGRVPLSGYAEMVAQHYFVYAALEETAAELADDPIVGTLLSPALDRVPALERDLEALHGPGWRGRVTPGPTTAAYADHIRRTAARPSGYVAHHYTRYLGDLSGGRFIGRAVQRAYGLRDGHGVGFYDFGELGSLPRFKKGYRARLDALPLPEAEIRHTLDEARLSYRFSTGLLADLGRGLPPELVA